MTDEQSWTITIPLPMPTWNRLLAMHPKARIKLREYLHHAVCISIMYGEDWPTSMEFRGKPYLTALFVQEYLQMIRPNKSRKLHIRKLRASLKSPA